MPGSRAVLRGRGVEPPAPRWGVVELRERDARTAEVGAVAERWSPEQAGPPPGPGGGVPGGPDLAKHAGPAGGPPPVVTPATDLWAVGVLLYRAVCGRPPFPEDDTERLLRAVRDGVDWNSRAHGRELRALRPLVAALLAADPARRPPLDEAAARLDALIAHAPQPQLGTVVPLPATTRLPVLRPPGAVERHRPRGAEAVATGRPGGDGDAERPGSGRRRGLLTGTLLVVLLVVLVAGGLVAAVLWMPRQGG